MSLKINKEAIRTAETICGSSQEQSVELDYVLPDYYPEIFRIIKCTAVPKITSCAVSGERLSYELTVCITIIYCSDNAAGIHSIEQKQSFTRTVNLEHEAVNPMPHINASTDYVNCRAVNPRRIDVRGAVTISVSVSGEKETEAICDAYGDNIQMKKVGVLCPLSMKNAAKRVTVSDELELSESMPPVGSILRADAQIISTDRKLIAGRLAAKGELKISMLYTAPADHEGENPVQTTQFSLPYSQLIDLEGIDEDYDCRIMPTVISCELTPHSGGDGESRNIQCDVLMLIECCAVRMSLCDIAVDEYSTSCTTSHTCVPVKIRKEPLTVESTYIVKGVCESKDSPISVIYDSWCDAGGLHVKNQSGKLMLLGNVRLAVIGRTEGGEYILAESEIPVETELSAETGLDLNEIHEDADIRIAFPVISCSYNISSDNTAEVKAEIGIRGWITDYTVINGISSIECTDDEDQTDSSDYALRLYFAKPGEELWDIAKKYRASAVAVAEENDLDDDKITENRMLLIPV